MIMALKSKDSGSKRDPFEPEKKRRDKMFGSGAQNTELPGFLGTKPLVLVSHITHVATAKERRHL